MNLAPRGREIACPAPHPSAKEPSKIARSFFILLSHAFVLILLGWRVHTFLVHREGLMFIPTVLVLSIITTSVSKFHSMLPRE